MTERRLFVLARRLSYLVCLLHHVRCRRSYLVCLLHHVRCRLCYLVCLLHHVRCRLRRNKKARSLNAAPNRSSREHDHASHYWEAHETECAKPEPNQVLSELRSCARLACLVGFALSGWVGYLPESWSLGQSTTARATRWSVRRRAARHWQRATFHDRRSRYAKQLGQLIRAATRTLGSLRTQDQRLKFVFTLIALIFKNRHRYKTPHKTK